MHSIHCSQSQNFHSWSILLESFISAPMATGTYLKEFGQRGQLTINIFCEQFNNSSAVSTPFPIKALKSTHWLVYGFQQLTTIGLMKGWHHAIATRSYRLLFREDINRKRTCDLNTRESVEILFSAVLLPLHLLRSSPWGMNKEEVV